MTLPSHSPATLALLDKIRAQGTRALSVGLAMGQADEGNLYPMDLFALGALKRNASTTAAFVQLIEAWNLVSARALLRLQIDTAIRFSAAWLVKHPHEFAAQITGGARIDKLLDREGQRLTDRHLVEVRSADLDWLPEVYSNLSGYVHLSGAHIMGPFRSVNSGRASIAVTATDEHMPEFSWVEIAECFLTITDYFLWYIEGWTTTKDGRFDSPPLTDPPDLKNPGPRPPQPEP